MKDLGYTALFDPRLATQTKDEWEVRIGDPVDPVRYVYSRRIVLAINAALAAGRPLLVRGQPGTGKTSLAPDVARRLGWRFYRTTVTSRTQARDLEWTFDAVARLADAQAGQKDRARQPEYYRRAGPLWWAFEPGTAALRGATEQRLAELGIAPDKDPDPSKADHERAVVLIDEIDKADPDVPNDLLLPLGSFHFLVDGVGPVTAKKSPFIVITTNEERDLPRAFLRRCVTVTIHPPSKSRLEEIGRAHFPGDDDLISNLVKKYLSLCATNRGAGIHQPSAAEFLDAVATVKALRIADTGREWQLVEEVVLAKRMTDLSFADGEIEEDDLTDADAEEEDRT